MMPGLDGSIPELDAIIEAHKLQPEIDALVLEYYPRLAKIRQAKALVQAIQERFGIDYTTAQLRVVARRLGVAGRD